MRTLWFWLRILILLPVALRFRREAPRFGVPPGDHHGMTGRRADLELLAIGDSIISSVGASSTSFGLVARVSSRLADAMGGGVGWESVGSIGATCEKVSKQLIARLPDRSADFIIVSVGTNDVMALISINAWRRRIDRLLEQLAEHSPDSVIGLTGVPPLEAFPTIPAPLRAVLGDRARAFNEVTRSIVCRHPNVAFILPMFSVQKETFATDGFHPSAKSCAALADTLATAMVSKVLPSAAVTAAVTGEDLVHGWPNERSK